MRLARTAVGKGFDRDDKKTRLSDDRSAALRMLSIHREIARGAYPSVRGLAEEHEVSVRTIQRDLEGLRDRLGAPIEYDPMRRGHFYAKKFKLPALELTDGEIIALVLGAGMISHYQGTPFRDDVQNALNKVAYLFPDHVSTDLGSIGSVFTFDDEEIRGRGTKLEENLTTVEKAIRECEVLEALYYTAGRDQHTLRRIAPHHIHVMGGAIYVIAHCYLRKDMRTFALDRIEHLVPTGERFTRRADFSIDRYLAGVWGIERGEKTRLIVRFDPETARFIRERRWHPTQVLEDQPDGSLLVQFEVAGTGEVTRWIRQYGSHAEVLGPEWLREEMRRDVERLAEVYARDCSSGD